MTAFYILGKGSPNNNEEIRFSLRSLAVNCPDIKRVVVFGENPGFLSDKVEYYPYSDPKGNKEWIIGNKIWDACNMGVVKGNFIFMNDDFFIVKPTSFKKYPNYARPSLQVPELKDGYRRSLNNTYLYLQGMNKTTYHFDVHLPIIYNSQKFLKLKPHLDYSMTLNEGLVVKSLYANYYGLEPTVYPDCKLQTLQTPKDFEKLSNTHCLSSSDAGWAYGIRQYLRKTFPNKSKYEV
jgi:hypothetical protein